VAAATLTSWLALVTVGGLTAAGFEIAPAARLACMAVAGPVALAAAARVACAAWRGPPVVAFERAEAAPCGPSDAETIRAAAQLRGTMGGAGYVHASRLLFPALAWLAALASAAELVSPRALAAFGAWPCAIAISATTVALLFPARPFWYREITGGGVLVSPPAAAAILTRRPSEEDAAAHVAGTDRGV
jgi:hypothetical protein